MSECTFCAELLGKETNNLLRVVLGEGYTTRVVRESKNFVVLPTIGPIVEGYLLIVPKQHYLSFGHIPAQHFREFMNLKEETRQVLREVYTTPIFFEHGPISESKRGGCSVEHAHLHAVPANVDLLDQLQMGFRGRSINNSSFAMT
jgi:ATP adenylyltransferase